MYIKQFDVWLSKADSNACLKNNKKIMEKNQFLKNYQHTDIDSSM